MELSAKSGYFRKKQRKQMYFKDFFSIITESLVMILQKITYTYTNKIKTPLPLNGA